MDIIEIYVNEEDSGRLDQYLANELDNMSRSYIQKLIKEKMVRVNGTISKSSYLINEGDYIELRLAKAKELEIIGENIDLDIIYQDEDLLIVNKAANMVVHPAPGNYSGTLVNALIYHVKNLSSINGVIRPGIVHRLDKDTSGLLIIAKNDKSHRFLSDQLKNRKIERTYLALVFGQVKNPEETINAPIGRHKKDRKKMSVNSINSKEAISHYRVLEIFDRYSLVEVSLETGRTHQIRVHMAHINHPILGDMVYSRGKNEFGLERQMLHAYKLGFIHPSSGQYMEFTSQVPEDFRRTLNILERKKSSL